jgi:hypothetical protein
MPEPLDALVGIYADPPAERPLWFREGVASAVERSERAEGWGTYPSAAGGAAAPAETKLAQGND